MIDTLVFSGGGVRCNAYLGTALAMKELSAGGMPIFCKRVAGTSGGALFSFLLALHARNEELGFLDIPDMVKDFEGASLKSFQDDTFGMSADLIRFVRHYGWNRGNKLEIWCEDMLEKHDIRRGANFAEFAEATNVDLRVIGTELSSRSSRVFSATDSPDFSVAKSLRISSSYPFFFTAPEISTECYTDGGVLMNYPISLFAGSIETTVGFMVKGCSTEVEPVTNIMQFIKALIGTMLDGANEKHMNEAMWKRTIVIETDISSMRNLGPKEGTMLKMKGYKTAMLNSEIFYGAKDSS